MDELDTLLAIIYQQLPLTKPASLPMRFFSPHRMISLERMEQAM